MRLRRFLVVLGLTAAVGLAAGCSSASDDPAGDAGPTTGATASSPSAAGGTDTAAVCDAVEAAYEKEKAELIAVLFEVLAANENKDQAALDTAKAKGEAVVGRLATAVEGEISGAANPQVKADLQAFLDTFGEAFTQAGLDDPAFDAKVDAAGAAAAEHCPALN